MTQRAPQRRGLGRGLGSLIPTHPSPSRPDGPPAEPRDGESWEGNWADGEWADAEPRERLSGDTEGAHGGQRRRAEGFPGPPDDGRPRASDASDGRGRDEASSTRAGAEALRPVAGARFAELPIEALSPNPRQPRQAFDEEAMAELVHSIREVGLLQPVVVRPLGADRYELVMGERRWRASRTAGLDAIPAIVRETGDDDLLRDALLENLHRAQLNPLEEAAAYQQLLDDFGCTHEQLAQRIGRSRPQITNTLRLLRLTPPVQRRIAAGVLSAGHARTLLSVSDLDTQERLAGRVVAEGITVRGLEELVTLGDSTPANPRRARTPHATDPSVDHLAERLSDLWETRVRIALGRSKGKITVEFASLEDLHRIVDLIETPPRGSS